MNKDRIAGAAKDVAGRIERQAGEWTGDAKMQIHGAAKQAAGKVQNAVGKAKDAVDKSDKKEDQTVVTVDVARTNRRRTEDE